MNKQKKKNNKTQQKKPNCFNYLCKCFPFCVCIIVISALLKSWWFLVISSVLAAGLLQPESHSPESQWFRKAIPFIFLGKCSVFWKQTNRKANKQKIQPEQQNHHEKSKLKKKKKERTNTTTKSIKWQRKIRKSYKKHLRRAKEFGFVFTFFLYTDH